MPIEQRVFFNVPYLLLHGPTVYNGHIRGPVTTTSVSDRLAVELSLPLLTTCVFLKCFYIVNLQPILLILEF